MKIAHYLIGVATMLTACATTPLSTSSGRPEVIIEGRSNADILGALKAHCLAGNGKVEAVTDTGLICDLLAPSYMMRITKELTREKTHYTLTPSARGYVLSASATYVFNGTPHDTDLGNGSQMAHDIQARLETIQASLQRL